MNQPALADARIKSPSIYQNPTPSARWRESFSFVPSISVGCADNRNTYFNFIQHALLNGPETTWARAVSPYKSMLEI